MLGGWNFPEVGSLRRPLLQEGSVPREHSGFVFDLNGRGTAYLRINSKLYTLKHFGTILSYLTEWCAKPKYLKVTIILKWIY
jgi:hypothetical protein